MCIYKPRSMEKCHEKDYLPPMLDDFINRMGQLLSSPSSTHPNATPTTITTNVTPESHERRQTLTLLLSNIHSLSNLTPDTVRLLRSTKAGRVCINQIRPDPDEYHRWMSARDEHVEVDSGIDMDDTDLVSRSLEYDAFMRRVVVKAAGLGGASLDCKVYQRSCTFFARWFGELANYLHEVQTSSRRGDTGGGFGCVGSREYTLCGLYKNSTKQADAAIKQFDSPHTAPSPKNNQGDYPLIVFEATLAQKSSVLADTAQRWLEGTQFKTKLVILADIQRVATNNIKYPNRSSSEPSASAAEHCGLGSEGAVDVSVTLWRLADPVQRVFVGRFWRDGRVRLNPKLKCRGGDDCDDVLSFRIGELLPDLGLSDMEDEVNMPLEKFGRYVRSQV